jgi:hypothetical protein
MWALSRAFPPSSISSADYARLEDRHSRVEMWAGVAAIAGAWAAISVGLAVRLPNSFWLVGYVLGWLVIVPVAVIASCRLSQGVGAWSEFWTFHEQKHRVSLRLLVPLYTLCVVVGIVSTAVLFSHAHT